MNPKVKVHLDRIRSLFALLFERYLEDIEKENRDSVIFTRFLKDISEQYLDRHTSGEIVRDFISGMTDQYFLLQVPEDMRPGPQPV
jgi:dGTPase